MTQSIATRPGYAARRISGVVIALAVLAVSLVVALGAFVLADTDDSTPARPAQPAVDAPSSDIGFTNDSLVLRNCPPRTACPS
jgi:hypothetical protein